MADRSYFIYILTSPRHTVFYTGFTSDLRARTYQHQSKIVDGFTKIYHVTKLVYYEVASDKFAALEREKQIKNYRREKKKALINGFNPTWKDLYEDL